MKSKVYVGFLEHIRHLPVYHHFRYPVYVYGIDLDELEHIDRKLPLFGYNRLRPTSIHDGDYLEDKPGSIREKLLAFLSQQEKARTGSVILVTSARYFNYVFNPVSFYYCLDTSGNVLRMVTEVSNTFGERHVYLPDAVWHDGSKMLHYTARKAFHVSPFNDMSGDYGFFFSPPGADTLDVKVILSKDGRTIFEARLHGRGRELTARSHLAALVRHPAAPHLTMPRIIRQALKLHYRKKMAWHDKPAPADPMTIRYRR